MNTPLSQYGQHIGFVFFLICLVPTISIAQHSVDLDQVIKIPHVRSTAAHDYTIEVDMRIHTAESDQPQAVNGRRGAISIRESHEKRRE